MSDMKPYTDSADLIGQSGAGDALSDRMTRDGYLFIRAQVPAEVLTAVYRDILEILQRNGWADTDARALGRPRPEGDPEYFGVYDEVQHLESFHALAHRPELIGVIEALVQESALVHPRNIARISPPNAQKFTTPPHQDYVLIQGATQTYTCWIPLMDCPISLGGLAVLAGSHSAGILPVHRADGPGGVGVDTDQLGFEWRANGMSLGDVLIFHSMTVHKALPNTTTDQIRISVDYRFQGVSQPIVHDSLDPHYNLAGWPDIYRKWSHTELQYYWRQYQLTLVPRDMTLLHIH